MMYERLLSNSYIVAVSYFLNAVLVLLPPAVPGVQHSYGSSLGLPSKPSLAFASGNQFRMFYEIFSKKCQTFGSLRVVRSMEGGAAWS
ncbi:hypothetical protein EK904_008097 [Melospiza melodia maxima]|nr:hypothetical protein EK904_008097 [Melospiza melodia maxima]